MKQPAPANFAGMNERVGVRGNTVENSARTPGFAARINRHVNHDRCADDVVTRNAANEAAVERVLAIVAHHEKAPGRNLERKNVGLAHKIAAEQGGFAAFGGADGVVFAQSLAVD